jgi:hypothetical protein
MFCLVTDLEDWRAYPAGVLAAAYRWRWDGSETALREAKSALGGPGPSTGPIFRSRTPGMIRQEHAARITACELVCVPVRGAVCAAAPARDGQPRRGSSPSTRGRSPSPPPAAPPSPPGPEPRPQGQDRQRFPAAGRGTHTRRAPARITVCGPLA